MADKYIEQPSRRRSVYVGLVAVVAGALLGVTRAPFWMGIIVLVPIVMFGVPYVMLHKLPPEPPPARKLPVLRKPTRWERIVFVLTKRWPDSYVEARLAHNDAVDAAVRAMPNHEAARALIDEAPYEAGARRD